MTLRLADLYCIKLKMIEVSTDKNRLEISKIHAFLTESYWAKGRTLRAVKKSIEHSLCFGLYLDKNLIGFARISTDYTIFAYLMDVFILPDYRGHGYAKTLMKAIVEHAELQSCHTWMLKTADAHSLYEQFGFKELENPKIVMERIIK